jgi:hypothetical protein
MNTSGIRVRTTAIVPDRRRGGSTPLCADGIPSTVSTAHSAEAMTDPAVEVTQHRRGFAEAEIPPPTSQVGLQPTHPFLHRSPANSHNWVLCSCALSLMAYAPNWGALMSAWADPGMTPVHILCAGHLAGRSGCASNDSLNSVTDKSRHAFKCHSHCGDCESRRQNGPQKRSVVLTVAE